MTPGIAILSHSLSRKLRNDSQLLQTKYKRVPYVLELNLSVQFLEVFGDVSCRKKLTSMGLFLHCGYLFLGIGLFAMNICLEQSYYLVSAMCVILSSPTVFSDTVLVSAR